MAQITLLRPPVPADRSLYQALRLLCFFHGLSSHLLGVTLPLGSQADAQHVALLRFSWYPHSNADSVPLHSDNSGQIHI
jgi:hypothetical protein